MEAEQELRSGCAGGAVLCYPFPFSHARRRGKTRKRASSVAEIESSDCGLLGKRTNKNNSAQQKAG
jgi:hypothetical protein